MTPPRIIVVCQARTGSTRLPRKVMLPLAGKPLLLRFLERVRAAKLPTEVVMATTTDPTDDLLVDVCISNGIPVSRGSVHDLLSRHVSCAQEYHADVVVKIPSDCPLIDPRVIDQVIQVYLDHQDSVDFVSNLHPATWPDGNDVEVMSMDVLEHAARAASKPHEREHTTPWMWDANPDVRCLNVTWSGGRDLSMTHRWTIDYPEDYMLIRTVFDHLYPENPRFTTDDILEYLRLHPEVRALNAAYAGVNWYRHHLDDLKTVDASQTRITRPKAS